MQQFSFVIAFAIAFLVLYQFRKELN